MHIVRKERDLQLPQVRKQLQATIEQELLVDDDIIGVFYNGSIGTQQEDIFSDIDLRIVVKDHKLPSYIANKQTQLARWGQISFIEQPSPNPAFFVVHYDNFIKLDVFYMDAASLKPSLNLQHIQIKKDITGLLTTYHIQSLALTFSCTPAIVETWQTTFFSHLHDVYRRTLRRELYFAMHNIDILRQLIVNGWYMLQEKQPNILGDWSKYEGRLSILTPEQLQLLESFHCEHNGQSITEAMNKLIDTFLMINRALCDKLGIPHQTERILRIIQQVR